MVNVRFPSGALRPTVVVACLYAVAAIVWAVGGGGLPGGRVLAVHLFTLGVLTNLVVALAHHFAGTLLHSQHETGLGRLVAVNAGVLMVLGGMVGELRWPVGVGATLLTGAVLWLYVDLRRMRKTSLTGRFAFVVRTYERACSAFFHAALLGALMGVGVVAGSWYGAVRLTHLHLNILGWGGLTLLATILFFGPTVMGARMRPGADVAAATWLGRAATGLTIAAFGLLATGAGGAAVLPGRLVAAAGLAVYAVGVMVVCVPVLRTGERASPGCNGRMLQAACCWYMGVVVLDILVIGTGQFRLLDALGAAMLLGVLAQAILAAVGYLVPVVWTRQPEARAAAIDLLGKLPLLRPVALNLGVVLVGLAAAADGVPEGVAASGWVLVAGAVASHLVLLASAAARGTRVASPAR